MKRPAFQFYPGDWLRSTDLRSCSVGARGLWIDMICLMHEGSPYGHLKVGSKVVLPSILARVVGADLADVEAWLLELRDAGVCSVNEDGCYLSRRMIRDEEIRQARASGGKKSLDNPNVPRPKEGKKDNQEGSPSDPSLGGSPASALASASSSEKQDQDQKQVRASRSPAISVELPAWMPAAAWQDWLDHRKRIRKPLTQRAAELCLVKLGELLRLGHKPEAVINQSIEGGWTGLFPLKNQGATNGPQGGNSAVDRVERAIAERNARATGRTFDQ